MLYDVCVIGGGMSGMTSAIATSVNGSKTLLIEKNSKLGKKIYATGNGKCNLTNKNIDINSHFNSGCPNYTEFLDVVLGDNACNEVIDFMSFLGVLTYDVNGYVYPVSNQASSVVWALTDKLRNCCVETLLNTEVKEIHKLGNAFHIVTDKETYFAKKLIIACGGNSYSKLGGTRSGYILSQMFNHNIIPIRPSLCGVKTKKNISELAGIRTRCKASIKYNDNEITETGELQFTDYGISGIMIFNLSSKIGDMLNKGTKASVKLDFLYDIPDERIEKLIESNAERTILALFNGLINDKLATYIIKANNINPKEHINHIDKSIIYRIIDELKNYNLDIISLMDYDNAQVTAGGVDISEIDPKTFVSLKTKDLYIVGETLDIDGICGGYNITFAILSGMKAGWSCNDKN